MSDFTLVDVQAQVPSLAVSLSRVGVTNVEKVIRIRANGSGQLYAARYVMRDPELARAVGLQDAGEKRCLGCHTDSTPGLRPFDYRRKLPLIEHWKGEKAWTRKRGGGVH